MKMLPCWATYPSLFIKKVAIFEKIKFKIQKTNKKKVIKTYVMMLFQMIL